MIYGLDLSSPSHGRAAVVVVVVAEETFSLPPIPTQLHAAPIDRLSADLAARH